MQNFEKIKRASLVSAIAIGAMVVGVGNSNLSLGFATPAFAQDDGDGNDGNAQGNQGGQGQGSKGSQSGQGNAGGTGSGQGGPDETSDGKGPRVGGPSSSGSGGGKPAWAQEGIPEVDLGRLSVARSPDMVLQRSLDEAIATWTPAMADFYNLPVTEAVPDAAIDTMLEALSLSWDTISIYDSPLQNLALFKDVLEDGVSQLPVTNDAETLLAVFLGVASDKTIVITEDTVVAILTILSEGLPTVIEVDVAAVAADAEAIRIAVLAGHDA